MRPLEIACSLANLLVFLILAVPRLRAMRGVGYLVLITLLLAALQALVEGPRWQMIPAYGLAVAFALISFLGGRVPVNRLAAGIDIGIGVLVMIIAVALPILLPVFHFPKPSGPYAIGTLTYDWVDLSRPELFTADPNDHRELMVQIWYPAQAMPAAPRAAYMPDADVLTPIMASILHLPSFFLTHFKYVTTHAVTAAPIAENQAGYPVLIYLTGLTSFRSASTLQIEALVSHGYVVVGIDQPGAAMKVVYPDGRQIPGRTKAEINKLVLQSIEPQTPAPTLDGVPMPDGLTPYFAQDATFVLDQLAQ